ILIVAEPDFPEPGVSAWINAHCHITRAGTKQVCCEQLSFHLRGPTSQLLPSIVFAHLDSDLPLYFWWQGEWSGEVNLTHIKWIDRLIFDSAAWHEPVSQFHTLRELSKALRSPERLCDLNWTRSSAMRLAVAHLFDHPTVLENREEIRSVEITHGPTDGVQARLLAGWLAALLNWCFVERVGERFVFQKRSGSSLFVQFTSQDEEGIRAIEICTPSATVRAEQGEKSSLIQTSIVIGSYPPLTDFMPAGKSGLLETLRAELATGGRHRVYRKAVDVMHPHWI
ncbi:MAG: glucose-6-phosphate dehydrogenase assembly protein OpcA, partial [Verrucomicrobiia bacterium]